MKLVPDVECTIDWQRAEAPWMTEQLKRSGEVSEEKDPKALRILLSRLNGLTISKRERLVVEDLMRKAYEDGVKSVLNSVSST